MASLPAFKRPKPIKPTSRIKYTYYVQPIGEVMVKGIGELQRQHNLPCDDDDLVEIDLGKGDQNPLGWRTSPEVMAIIYETRKGCTFYYQSDYWFYRVHPDTRKVTTVPRSVFEVARPTRPVQRSKTALKQVTTAT